MEVKEGLHLSQTQFLELQLWVNSQSGLNKSRFIKSTLTTLVSTSHVVNRSDVMQLMTYTLQALPVHQQTEYKISDLAEKNRSIRTPASVQQRW